jgi:hypothetical protein
MAFFWLWSGMAFLGLWSGMAFLGLWSGMGFGRPGILKLFQEFNLNLK